MSDSLQLPSKSTILSVQITKLMGFIFLTLPICWCIGRFFEAIHKQTADLVSGVIVVPTMAFTFYLFRKNSFQSAAEKIGKFCLCFLLPIAAVVWLILFFSLFLMRNGLG